MGPGYVTVCAPLRATPGATVRPRARRGLPLFEGVAIVSMCLALSCSSKLSLYPVLDGCGPTDGAICAVSPPASGQILPSEAGSRALDAQEVISESEGGSCGMADTLITAPCAPCIEQFCCQADAVCSGDDGCLSLVQCIVSGTPCSTLSQTSTNAFDDLTSCFNRSCAQQCESISSHDF